METLLLALHGGMLVSNGGNNTSGVGERIEAEALAQEASWFSFGAVGAYGHFSGTDPDAEGPGPFPDTPVHVLSGGLRAYVQSTSSSSALACSASGATMSRSEAFTKASAELVVGGNLATIGDYRVQLLLDASVARPTGDSRGTSRSSSACSASYGSRLAERRWHVAPRRQ